MNRFRVDPQALAYPWNGDAPPLALLDLEKIEALPPLVLPHFPVIGMGAGDRVVQGASQLDAIIEPPISAGMLVESICARPQAGAVAVQLLRLIEAMDIGAALVAESLAYGLLQRGGEHEAWRASQAPVPALARGRVDARRAGDTLDIRLDRENAHNAIDHGMRDALREAFELAALDSDIRRITLHGAGKSFSVGADLSEFGTTRDPVLAHSIRMQTLPAHAIARCAERLEIHVQGACVGSGLEMAAFAGRITAGRKAWFHLPELSMGLIPGAGGCVSVSRRIGRQRAALLILSGRRISADVALRWGLIDAIIDD